MLTLACRVYRFNAAHHLEDGSPCTRMHGHNYELHVKLRRVAFITDRPFVMMFDKVDEVVQPIVDAMDHRFLVSFENKDMQDPYFQIYPERCLQLPLDSITTERLAEYFTRMIGVALKQRAPLFGGADVQLHSVLLWETPRNYAEVICDAE